MFYWTEQIVTGQKLCTMIYIIDLNLSKEDKIKRYIQNAFSYNLSEKKIYVYLILKKNNPCYRMESVISI